MKRLGGAILAVLLSAGCDSSGSPSQSPKRSPRPSATPVTPKPMPADPSASPAASAAPEAPVNPALLEPSQLTETAPAEFKVRFETTRGVFVIRAVREWAPNGADRFYNLAKNGFYDDVRFFRVIGGFMAQFGIHGNPKVSAKWRGATIPDDPVKMGNTRGRVTYAMAGPNTRTTQLFINFGDNSGLDRQGFPSFGEVVEGMDVVDKIHSGYGEGAPRGHGPDQQAVQLQGNAYLNRDFPKLDYVKKAMIVP